MTWKESRREAEKIDRPWIMYFWIFTWEKNKCLCFVKLLVILMISVTTDKINNDQITSNLLGIINPLRYKPEIISIENIPW